ncbi:MAG: MATE family efflux transporter [Bacteroidota bacterium]|nr:MATE family efflux transporter [Bacteroidota bacterium]
MNKKILKLAVPNIISNITVPLVGLVDIALMGHQQSEIFIGAVALGGMVFMFIYSGFGFLRMGTSGLTAQAYGKRSFEQSIHTLSRSLLVAISAAFLLIIFQKPLSQLIFSIIGGSPEVEQYAKEYFFIRIWAAPATLSIYAFTGWFLGMQNSRSPMAIAITINLMNVILSISFVKFLDMTSDGVALGTVLAQYSGLFLSIIFFKKYYARLLSYWHKKTMMNIDAFKEFFRVNRDILIRTLLLTGTLFYFNAKSASFGDETLAVNSLLLQFLWVFSFFIDGFAFAAESLTGKYVGANNYPALKQVVKKLFIWGFAISLPVTLLYYFGGNTIMHLLTNNQDIINASKPYHIWIALIPITTFAAFLWDGIYVGATASAIMRNSMIISSLFIFIPVFYFTQNTLENHGLWLAMTLFMASRGIFLGLFAKKAVFEN